MNKRKVFLSVVAAVLVAIITFCTFGNGKTVLAADDDKEYVFKNAASTDSFVRTDSGSLEAYDELVYCMEIDKAGPNESATYKRSRLSDTSYSSDVKSKLMVVLMDMNGIHNKLDELSATVPEASTYWSYYGDKNYVAQHLVWIILSEDYFINQRTDSYGYHMIDFYVTGTDHAYTDADSLWNKVFVPLLDYIDSKKADYPVGQAAGQYDASFYTPDTSVVQLLLGRGFVNKAPATGSIRITKTIEGPVTASDLENLTFNVTDSNGKSYGPYVLGKDFTYDSANDIYFKDITDLDTSLTYTVEETSYEIDGTTVTVTYEIDNTSGTGNSVKDVAVTGGAVTTVAFKDSYEKKETVSSIATPTPVPSANTTTDETTTPSTSGGTTTNTTDDKGLTTDSITEDPTVPSVKTTDGNGNESSTKADSAKTTAEDTKVSSTETNAPSATPTPTSAASKTTTNTATDKSTTTSVVKTGETTSYVLYACAFAALVASGVIFIVRDRKFGEK